MDKFQFALKEALEAEHYWQADEYHNDDKRQFLENRVMYKAIEVLDLLDRLEQNWERNV